MVTVFLPMFIGTATGSIFVEAMFRVPGLGSYFVSSIRTRDYPARDGAHADAHRSCSASPICSRTSSTLGSTPASGPGGARNDGRVTHPPARPRRQRRPLWFAWRRFAANKAAVAGGAVLAVLILTAILAPLITKTGPNDQAFLDAGAGPPSVGVLVRRRRPRARLLHAHRLRRPGVAFHRLCRRRLLGR